MKVGKIISSLEGIAFAFPTSTISTDYRYLLIPEVGLPDQYNLDDTPLLLDLHPESDYLSPDAYVDRRLRVYGQKSLHLDENLTNKEMLKKGWVKLCVQMEWNQNFSLIDCIVMFIEYLEKLRE